MESKLTYSVIAIALTFIAFFPYIRSIYSGVTKPHVFSWVVWATTTLLVFFTQLEAHAGYGAWPTAVSGTIAAYIALLAYKKRGDLSITRTDWAFFIAALASIPVWQITANPLWAVVILTAIDLLGFAPTVRKAFYKPYQEDLLFYVLSVVRNVFLVMSLERYSLTTLLFPVCIATSCLMFIVLLAVRRKQLA